MSIAFRHRIADWVDRRNQAFVGAWPSGGRTHRWRFMLLRGVVLWGLPIVAGLLFTALFFDAGNDTSFLLLFTAICTPAILGMGLFYGWVQWNIMERAYRRLTTKGQDAAEPSN